MIRTVPVDPTSLSLLGLTVEPKSDFETKVQKVDRDGVPVWTVIAYSVAESGDLKVAVASPTIPDIRPGHPLEFIGLRAGAYVSGNRAVFYWTAEAVA